MSEWNAAHKRIAIHYGVLQITAGATRSSGKITGGLSPAVKSGEQTTALTEELLSDIIRRYDMNETVRQLCEKACAEYCENGFISEEIFNALIKCYESLNFRAGEEMKAFMRNIIASHSEDSKVPSVNSTGIRTLTSTGVIHTFIIDNAIKKHTKEI